MNGVLLVACAVAVVCVSAVEQRQLPLWLPQHKFNACFWCSGRYYRQSYESGDRNNYSLSRLNDYRDLAHHAGYFYDILPQRKVRNERESCQYFVNRYNKQQGPVRYDLIEGFINQTFFGHDEKTDYSDKPHPLAFQCCHWKYGSELIKNGNEQQSQNLESTTAQPLEHHSSSTTLSSLIARAGKHPLRDTNKKKIAAVGAAKEEKIHLNGTVVAPAATLVKKKIINKLNETGVSKDEGKKKKHEESQKNSTKTHRVGENDKKLSGRTDVPGRNSEGGLEQTDNGRSEQDEYKAKQPKILAEGYDCNALTQQLYLELSQPVNDRQQIIQRALQQMSMWSAMFSHPKTTEYAKIVERVVSVLSMDLIYNNNNNMNTSMKSETS